MKPIKKNFHIPPSYTFISNCSNPATVISLASFVSSCSSPLNHVGGLRPSYQQRKFLSTSNASTTSSSSSSSAFSIAAIHITDDGNFETPPSTNNSSNDCFEMNPFENLSKTQTSQSLNKSKLFSSSSKTAVDHRSITKKSKNSTASDPTKTNSTTINEATFAATSNGENISVKGKHRLANDVERVVQEHLTYVREEMCDGWDLIHEEGEMKVYRREVEENGIVVDPLKIFHAIQGVTGHEICHYFWEYQHRMEWETTLDSTKIIEALDQDTVIFFQMHKRVWPTAQRDSCFWSHIRCISNSEEDQPTWLVVNYTTPHPLAPIKPPQVRLIANVAMICETIINEPPLNPKDIKRENIQCKLAYVAFVNPGGWVPSAAVRNVAKREYPRFLRRFTSYVIEQTRDKPILF
ncbi:unnamed protein product [Rotaria sordida]|uniref:START domain-containing protein n=1 Tax=Rotaria sordida TaxID=392033 RepID=A0A813UJ28_9BILA|nr:unnamed protein product [Rotaria sordida]CAF3578565.1 unnamed protein product [Rotaria sordida]